VLYLGGGVRKEGLRGEEGKVRSMEELAVDLKGGGDKGLNIQE